MKIFSAIVFFVVMALSGCGCDERPYELWLDSACSPNDQEVIRDAVDVLNAWTLRELGEALIEIGGVDAVDHSKALTPEGLNPNVGRDFVVCMKLDELPADEQERWEPLFGWGVPHGDAVLFIEPLQPTIFKKRILHELGHYIGLGHLSKTDTRPGIMHPHPTATADGYTIADTELLCGNYDCKGGAR